MKKVAHNEHDVACMHECGPNQFKWPNRTESCWYENVICTTKGPTPVNNRVVFQHFDDDFEHFKNLS